MSQRSIELKKEYFQDKFDIWIVFNRIWGCGTYEMCHNSQFDAEDASIWIIYECALQEEARETMHYLNSVIYRDEEC